MVKYKRWKQRPKYCNNGKSAGKVRTEQAPTTIAKASRVASDWRFETVDSVLTDEDIVYSLSKDKGAKARRGSSVPLIVLSKISYLFKPMNLFEHYDFPNESGIYACVCLANSRAYVGQTQHLSIRKQQHITSLQNNQHYNTHLQHAWNKYGDNNFQWVILELCPVECLDEREIYWIDYYNSFENGFNQTLGGDGKRGYHESETTKFKHAEATRKSWTSERRETQRQRMTGSNNPMFGRYGELNPAYGRNCSGECGGMYGKHHTDISNEKNRQAHLGKKNANSKAVICVETQKLFYSQGEAGRIMNCDSSTINKCCRGVKKTAGGYHWRYASPEEITLYESQIC